MKKISKSRKSLVAIMSAALLVGGLTAVSTTPACGEPTAPCEPVQSGYAGVDDWGPYSYAGVSYCLGFVNTTAWEVRAHTMIGQFQSWGALSWLYMDPPSVTYSWAWGRYETAWECQVIVCGRR